MPGTRCGESSSAAPQASRSASVGKVTWWESEASPTLAGAATSAAAPPAAAPPAEQAPHALAQVSSMKAGLAAHWPSAAHAAQPSAVSSHTPPPAAAAATPPPAAASAAASSSASASQSAPLTGGQPGHSAGHLAGTADRAVLNAPAAFGGGGSRSAASGSVAAPWKWK
eukprot:scaffold5749_cov43-Phaeocystis_antarctica.AAC.1